MRINAFVPIEGRLKIVSIFGYSTKGIPGIEIKGIGSRGNLIKEKLVYLCRLNRIKMPLKRYVICIVITEIVIKWSMKMAVLILLTPTQKFPLLFSIVL